MDSFVGNVWKVFLLPPKWILDRFTIYNQYYVTVSWAKYVLETQAVLTKQQRFKPSEEYETKK